MRPKNSSGNSNEKPEPDPSFLRDLHKKIEKDILAGNDYLIGDEILANTLSNQGEQEHIKEDVEGQIREVSNAIGKQLLALTGYLTEGEFMKKKSKIRRAKFSEISQEAGFIEEYKKLLEELNEVNRKSE